MVKECACMTWTIRSGKKSNFKLVIEYIPSALYYTALLELDESEMGV